MQFHKTGTSRNWRKSVPFSLPAIFNCRKWPFLEEISFQADYSSGSAHDFVRLPLNLARERHSGSPLTPPDVPATEDDPSPAAGDAFPPRSSAHGDKQPSRTHTHTPLATTPSRNGTMPLSTQSKFLSNSNSSVIQSSTEQSYYQFTHNTTQYYRLFI